MPGKNRLRLSPAQREQIVRLRHAGHSWAEVAAALGVTGRRGVLTLAWYGRVCLGVLGRAEFEELKRSLRNEAPERPRPALGDFLFPEGAGNRGWGSFLEDAGA